MGRFQDLTGQEFGKLIVLKQVDNIKGRTAWLCKCECGNEVMVTGECLKQGHTKSCGCLHRKGNEIIKCNDQNSIIVINNNQFGKFNCVIDTEDVERIKDYYWNVRIDKRHPKCLPYVETRYKGKRVHLHRLLTNCPNGLVVDHIDGNPLNNVKSNLRIVTQHQNCINKAKRFNKGYSYNKRDNYYQVYVGGRTIGRFRTEQEAIEYRTYVDTLIKDGSWDIIEKLKCINLSSRGITHQE